MLSQNQVKRKVFVGGPIQYALKEGGFDQSLQSLLNLIIDSYEARGYEVLSAHREEKFGEVNMDDEAEYVTGRDFRWASECDLYICILPQGEGGKPYRSDGTCVELGWVSAQSKPIIMVNTPGANYSHLLKGLYTVTETRYLNVVDVQINPDILINASDKILGEAPMEDSVSAGAGDNMAGVAKFGNDSMRDFGGKLRA